MALDFAVLDSADHVVELAQIPLDAHDAVFFVLDSDAYPLLSRISDYYTDVQYPTGDLAALVGELGRLSDQLENSEHAAVVQGMIRVASYARASNIPIDVLAD